MFKLDLSVPLSSLTGNRSIAVVIIVIIAVFALTDTPLSLTFGVGQ
ncbi:hypothetical protein ACFV1N_44245 [Streptosporangium canum]